MLEMAASSSRACDATAFVSATFFSADFSVLAAIRFQGCFNFASLDVSEQFQNSQTRVVHRIKMPRQSFSADF
jgi:hypothetical protein